MLRRSCIRHTEVAFPEKQSKVKQFGQEKQYGYVYLFFQKSQEIPIPQPFEEPKEAHYYKVGRSIDPKDRDKNLRAGNPHKLILKWCKLVPDIKEGEESVLKAFKDKGWHVQEGGGTEWFFVPDDEKREMYRLFFDALELEPDSEEKKRLRGNSFKYGLGDSGDTSGAEDDISSGSSGSDSF